MRPYRGQNFQYVLRLKFIFRPSNLSTKLASVVERVVRQQNRQRWAYECGNVKSRKTREQYLAGSAPKVAARSRGLRGTTAQESQRLRTW